LYEFREGLPNSLLVPHETEPARIPRVEKESEFAQDMNRGLELLDGLDQRDRAIREEHRQRQIHVGDPRTEALVTVMADDAVVAITAERLLVELLPDRSDAPRDVAARSGLHTGTKAPRPRVVRASRTRRKDAEQIVVARDGRQVRRPLDLPM